MRIVWLGMMLCAVAVAAGPKIGDPAPPMVLAQVLQAPAGVQADWAGLKGKAVVLEFWATWCAGCREQIPHLNQLAEQFRDKPVRFISVTDEEPGLVARFLKDYSIAGWIGIDQAGRTFRNFTVEGRPQAALIDANGVLRGLGNTPDLTGQLLEDLLAEKPVAFSFRSLPGSSLQSAPEPFFQTMIRPAAPVEVSRYSPGAVAGKPGRSYEIYGTPLRTLLAYAYGLPERQIEAPAWAGEDRFDTMIAALELTDQNRAEMLRRTLTDTFQIKLHKESRPTAGYVLAPRAGVAPKLRPAAPGATSHWGKPGDITAVAVPLASLVASAENALEEPVFDETHLLGRFDFELKWTKADAESFIQAVREQLGLDLARAVRPLDYLIVDSAVRPKAW